MPPSDSRSSVPALQSQLDAITAQTRALVQPERLAVTDTAIHNLLSDGIESRILSVGATAPSFALPAASATVLTAPSSGKLVCSDDLLALGPLIINFFRGRWCPYCVTELEAWQSLYPAVRERGALLVAISPQLPRQNDFLVQQHSLTFPVLSDTGCALAAQFGITYTLSEQMRSHLRSILINLPFIHGESKQDPYATWRLPLPATFVIGQNSKVLFAEAHADHRVRPDPTDVLRSF
jgi:peroxiredoxin